MGNNKSSLKSTIAVYLTNYLDAGAIVAGASGLSLWQNYLGLTEGHLGFLNAISANCLGAAIGAIIGGFLADKYGRKAIYTYNMLIYMIGVLLVVFTVNFPMLGHRSAYHPLAGMVSCTADKQCGGRLYVPSRKSVCHTDYRHGSYTG